MSSLDRNLEKRMKQTWDSELDPELVTPMTAGFEEEPDKAEVFPIVRQFHQTNMRAGVGGGGTGKGSRHRSNQSERGHDED